MTSDQPNTNRIIYNSAEHDDSIENVTVFQSNRAEVTRRVNLNLKAGQNYIHIERLPSSIDEHSIRVDGTGTAVIFDVIYHSQSHNLNRLASATANLRRVLEALQNERNIAREQSVFLANYGRTLDGKSVDFEDVQRFLDAFAPRQLAAAKRIQELDTQIEKAQGELNDAERKEYEDARGARRGTVITVTALADMDGPAELMLTYVVFDASWTPLYDIRAFIAKTPKGTSTVALHYRASITQITGENWSDVALTLSTASPHLGGNIPKLSPWHIGFPTPATIHPIIQSAALVPRSRSLRSTLSPETESAAYALLPPRMAIRQARIERTGILSTTFRIPGRSDIPSDEGSHKVVIAMLDLRADLEWICIPREKECVFLSCKIVNSSEFILLPGEASVYMDNNFVSKTRIEHVSPNDSFKTSLGVDPTLRVTYPVAKTLNRTAQSGFIFTSKEEYSVSAQSQRITIRNTRPASVSVRVLDHIPVSTDTRLKVDVLSPNLLDFVAQDKGTDQGKGKVRPSKELREGIKVQWAPPEVGGEGTVEWNCDIAPFSEAELELAWEVSAPVGQKWHDA